MRPPDAQMRSPVTRQRDRANSQFSTTREVIHTHKDGQPLAAQIRKVRSLWFLSVEAARTIATLAYGAVSR